MIFSYFSKLNFIDYYQIGMWFIKKLEELLGALGASPVIAAAAQAILEQNNAAAAAFAANAYYRFQQ